ncbi:hypothetical protein EX30DRAFT_313040, partial [Ascodesmis nigricans]
MFTTRIVWEIWVGLLLAAVAASGGVIVDRKAWKEGFDINTDYHDHWPNTGVLREYWLNIQNVTLAPDGFERKNILAFNGTVPGPAIVADWGDTIRVHLTNHLQNNGTGIHWHGQRMYRKNLHDGVSGVTECPVAPGATTVYEYQATQYGTSWYHSHFGLQYGDGAFGPVVINGPASAQYDHDLGPIMIHDWQHESIDTVFHRWHQSKKTGLPYSPNGLINGKNTCPKQQRDKKECKSDGERWETTLQRGKKYRLRLVNASVDNHMKVSLDGHKMWVIAADFVPVKPFEVEWLDMAIGQRYDVVIHATGRQPSYWFRAVSQDSCSFQSNPNDIKAIFRLADSTRRGFSGHRISPRSPFSSLFNPLSPLLTPRSNLNASTPVPPPPLNPTSKPFNTSDFCADPPSSSLLPIVPKTPPPVPQNLTTLTTDLQKDHNGLFQWTINKSPLSLDPSNPTVFTPGNGSLNANIYECGYETPWVFVKIESGVDIAHPIHLHGHDFLILDEGEGAENRNPPRRDTATLEQGGKMLIAFQPDNPGAWLMHCHIIWHQDMGFGIQFLESVEHMEKPSQLHKDMCTAWDKYQ